IGALMCSHLSAFRIASNIRKVLMRHITALPLGVAERYGSGKLRRIVNDSSAATETYLAHRLPDKAGAIATPVGLLVLLFAFDWRLGVLSLIPVLLGFL
ncbi:ABC transporter transmembrane domain-containing protein, partial [Clostridium sp. SL.3.18]|nr:ABC transporter transmembrane domain-containing protein [Clostridium sp. SL.3.18]